MEPKIKDLKNVFVGKQEILEKARLTLKKEFIGIDNVIDEVINNISSWYTLHHIQEKPLVLCLWGLTGTGKTSLVYRLVELINFVDSHYHFDLGDKDSYMSFSHSLSELCDNKDTSPVIITLDEFQHSRTLEGPFRQEIKSDKNRLIWDIIDSGKISFTNYKSGLWELESNVIKLTHLVKSGVQVKDGFVSRNKLLYCKEMEIRFVKTKQQTFVPQSCYQSIIDFAGEDFNLYLFTEVREYLKTLNASETIVFLNKVLKIAQRPTVKSFSKALIFVLGNIDEAYSMSNNYSVDIDADEFHEMSLQINVPKIKQALKERFRNEQIARLGNTHIIYPALSKKSYYQIINMELASFKEKFKDFTKVEMKIDDSVIETIYKEGVYPTQGVRPLFTTVNQIIKCRLSIIVAEIIKLDLKVGLVQLKSDNEKIFCEYLLKNKVIHQLELSYTSNLEKLRKNRQDDLQAITAVHESGHAIISALSLNVVPEVIMSVTSDVDNHGFVYTKFTKKYFSKIDMLPKVAFLMGGIVAEEIIFGKEYLTAGGSSDIERATELVSQLVRNNGFGKTAVNYAKGVFDVGDHNHNMDIVEDEISEIIQEGRVLAEQILTTEKKLLLQMANILSDNTSIKKPEIIKLIEQFSTQKITNISEKKYFRNKLKAETENILTANQILEKFPITLNKRNS